LAEQPLVVSVVLTWNNFHDTDEALASLTGQTWPNHRVIVADNGSGDGSFEALTARWTGRAAFVRNPSNLGVGGGYNTGIRAALDAGADIIGLFNNDVVAAPDTVERMAECLRSEGWAAASPLLTYYHAPERLWFAGIRYHPVLGYTRHLGQGMTLAGAGIAQGSAFPSDYLPLTACFFSRAAFERAGLVEERLFVSHDDVEWFLRAKKAGLTWGVLAEPLVRHKVSVTVGVAGGDLPSPLVAYYWGRNSLLVGSLHFRGAALVPYLAGQFGLCFPYQAFRLARARRWASLAAYLRGIGGGMRLIRRPDR
jgi:GT2 family glycosyltransferase